VAELPTRETKKKGYGMHMHIYIMVGEMFAPVKIPRLRGERLGNPECQRNNKVKRQKHQPLHVIRLAILDKRVDQYH